MLGYRVLGVLAASRNGAPVDLNRPLERRLLACLLVNRSRAASDDQISHALWPERLPENPGQALRTSISRLRRMLGTSGAIARVAGGYRLIVEPGSVDADRFEALVASADTGDRAARLREALDLWTSDDAYADFRYHDFVQAEAQRLNDLRLQTQEDLCVLRLASGEADRLVPDLQAMVTAHPLRESLYGLLMLALYRAGRQAEALRVFQVARERLREELEIEPSPALVDLEERILVQDPALELTPPPAPNNLPSRITSIVGRSEAITASAQQLQDRRLVTITGPGGVGKTTVAIEAARDIATKGQRECWYIDVGPVKRNEQLLAHVTDELALLLQQPPDDHSPKSSPSRLIGATPMLILLDNCEHVIEEIGDVVGTILKECPNVVVLASSRERLGLTGEWVLPVDPLFAGTEEEDCHDPRQAREEYPALALLIDRCESASPGFRLLPEDVPAAMRLCRQLDGLPLAIELAAAQVASLSIVDLERYVHGHPLILGTQRGGDSRHRTLETTIAWSFDLLDERQQECLELLARVNGPFTITDAARLATSGDEAEAAALIALLRDKSLVRASPGISRASQFEMLTTIREFARSRASEAGKDHDHDLRHARCFLSLAERAEGHLFGGPQQLRWMTRCTRNTTDLLQAVRTLIGDDCIEEAMDLVAHVGAAWTRYHTHLEAYPVVRDAITAAGSVVCDSTPRVHVVASWMSPNAPGRPFRGGLAHAREAQRTARIVGDAESALAATALVGLNQWLSGQSDQAVETVREACRRADREDSGWAGNLALIIAGIVEHALDPSRTNHGVLERAVDSASARSDEVGEAAALGFLGSALKDAGEYARARAAFRQAHLSGRRVGDPSTAIAGAAGHALTSWLDDDPDGAMLAGDQALALLVGLSPGAKHAALSQLFLAPEQTFTLSTLDDGLSVAYAQPPGAQAPAFIRFLLELAEGRAVKHLDRARVTEIREGLARLGG